ncbi:GNAT family N-acetyltransferase [Paenibacillus tyrfis]|uniref:GNAT family N-acetyltransferase n=1 Tax=Paenibacillus tyrfis TaxID=1501230 RepID=UPI00118091A1|nr:GNAT family N-acetyltransferase [Paenibacillus tyrfis]
MTKENRFSLLGRDLKTILHFKGDDLISLERDDGCKLSLRFASVSRYMHTGGIFLDYIFVPENLRRQGIGTEVMNTLCLLADRYGFDVTLMVSTVYGVEGNDLVNFYAKHGFKGIEGKQDVILKREAI